MTDTKKDEEFGYALLAVIEERAVSNNRQDVVLMNVLGSVVRAALHLKEPEIGPPSPPPQLRVRPEFPHLRVKYDANHNEIGRKICHSLTHLGEILRSDPMFMSVLPIDAPLPRVSGDATQSDETASSGKSV